jgi:hypothetical protein
MTMEARCRQYGRGLAYAALLACIACDGDPTLVLGQVHADATVIVDAAVHPDEDHECTETDLVCGSDGKTYQNRCRALMAGVLVVKLGAC